MVSQWSGKDRPSPHFGEALGKNQTFDVVSFLPSNPREPYPIDYLQTRPCRCEISKQLRVSGKIVGWRRRLKRGDMS